MEMDGRRGRVGGILFMLMIGSMLAFAVILYRRFMRMVVVSGIDDEPRL